MAPSSDRSANRSHTTAAGAGAGGAGGRSHAMMAADGTGGAGGRCHAMMAADAMQCKLFMPSTNGTVAMAALAATGTASMGANESSRAPTGDGCTMRLACLIVGGSGGGAGAGAGAGRAASGGNEQPSLQRPTAAEWPTAAEYTVDGKCDRAERTTKHFRAH